MEKEIAKSYNKFDCLNIDKDVVRTNDVNNNDFGNSRLLQIITPRIRKLLQDYLLFQAKINIVKQ